MDNTTWIEHSAKIKADKATQSIARFLLNLFVWTLVPYYIIGNIITAWRNK